MLIMPTTYVAQDGHEFEQGRPRKLTPERIEALIANIKEGCYFKQACAAVGITTDAIYRYIRIAKAKNHEEPEQCDDYCRQICDLWKRVQIAEAEAEALQIKRILSDPRWESKAWFLERKYPQRWGRRSPDQPNEGGEDQLKTLVTPDQMQQMALGVLQTIGAAAILDKLNIKPAIEVAAKTIATVSSSLPESADDMSMEGVDDHIDGGEAQTNLPGADEP